MARLGKFLRYACLLLWSFICLFPIYCLVTASFKSPSDQFAGPTYLPYVDFAPTLEAWVFILADPYEGLLRPFGNSLLTGAAATLITVLFAVFAIYGTTRLSARERQWGVTGDHLLFALLASRILPPVVIALPLYLMAQWAGTLDNLVTLVFVYAAINLPVAVWLLRPVLGNKATEVEESARLEGAGHMRILFEFVLPINKSAVAAVGLLVFILCWNEYLFAAFLTTNKAMTLAPWAIGQLSMKEAQVGGEAEEWAHMAAATVFMILPVLLAALLSQRMLSHNLTRRHHPDSV
jgi:multiple sugar transport system permease protein